MKNSHCSFCGTAFGTTDWPRPCGNCENITWANPTPVVVVLQPVLDNYNSRFGIAVAKRAIEPGKGKWSLIGGFMEVGESAEEAAYREFREETSIDARELTLMDTSPNDTGLLLIAFRGRYIPLVEFEMAEPCPENEELGVLWDDEDCSHIAFPHHRRWIEELRASYPKFKR